MIQVKTKSVSTVQTMLFLTLRLLTTLLLEQVNTLLFTSSVVHNVIQAGSGNDSIVMAGDGMTSDRSGRRYGDQVHQGGTSDTVTVTSTTIGGAKTLIYEKAAATPVTTGAGADLVKFEDEVSGLVGVISTNSGNDSIQFLKNAVKNVQLGAGADSVYGGEIISLSTISGGAGPDTFLINTLNNAIIYGGSAADSVSITGSLYGATVDFGAGNELPLCWCYQHFNCWWSWQRHLRGD